MNKNIYIIANWKMNPLDAKRAKLLFDTVKKGIKKTGNIEVVICPPFLYCPLFSVSRFLKLGAQDCFWEKQGAYTGEVSAGMLKDLGCEYVIIGHSERRLHFKETDEVVNKKVKAVLEARLKPVLCVGEQVRDAFDPSGRIINEMSLAVGEQLKKNLDGIGANKLREIIIAYEPIWAIGSGNPCLPDDAMKARLFIKKTLVNLYERQTAEKIKILYGGSIDSQNAVKYVDQADIDGLLVGGASLNASEFIRIVKSVEGIDRA